MNNLTRAAARWSCLAGILLGSAAHAEPQLLRLGEAVPVRLETKGAVEEFAFNVAETGYVIAQFDQAPSGFYPAVSYHAGPTLLRNEPKDPGVRLEPGHYAVRIRSRFPNDTAKQPFTLTLTFSAEDDPSEPNEALPRARPLTLGEPTLLRLLPKGDTDLLTFTVPETAYVRVMCAEKQSGAHPAAEVLDAAGQSLGKPEKEFTRRLEPGTYYLRVAAKFDDWSLQPVTVTTDVFVEGDPSEPNDAVARARPVALDEQFRFWILPAGDRDVLRVEAPADGYLSFSYTRAANPLNLVPEWLDDDGKVIATTWVRKVAAGPVYLRVRDKYDWSDRQSPRAVYGAVSFSPEMDPSEPNDTFETARPVALNSAATFYVLPEHDVDVWRFEVPERGMVTASLTQAPLEPSLARYRAELYDANRQPVAFTGAGQNAFEVILDPGAYFLKMDRSDDEHTGFEPLTVELEYTALSAIRRDDVKFTLIGLGEESNAKQQQQFRQLTEVMGGTYIPIAQTATDVQRALTRELRQVGGSAPRRGPARRIWLLVVVGVAVGIAVWRARGGRRAR